MTEEEFEKIDCEFKCGFNPATKEPSNKKIRKDEFQEIDLEEHSFLFKLAAKQAIDEKKSAPKE